MLGVSAFVPEGAGATAQPSQAAELGHPWTTSGHLADFAYATDGRYDTRSNLDTGLADLAVATYKE